MGKKIEKEKWTTTTNKGWREMQFSKFRDFKFENKSGDYINELLKSLSNKETTTERFWEILKDCELYMTNFEKFNDIDEGRYSFYSSHTDPQEIESICQKIKNMKKDKNICAFADLKRLENNENNLSLMWAHYGGSHCGVKIDFRIDPNYDGDIYKIDYNIHDNTYNINLVDNRLSLSTENTDSEIINILTTKKPCFKYECEYRAISSSTEKLPIIIDKITLGRRFTKEIVCSQENEEKSFEDDIKNLAKKILEVSSNKKIEIWAYKTRYSKEPKKVEFK
ncbi:DUF2971 domain-containing protein [Helicobacter pullorum]|uniref:Protein of uncharacterized function (DUF2971) n=1 Tax=Helicobacter pullorum TaxID=35818 RepID=A0A377PZ72_9HELI|nr:DUF2971 domain-containing protein [Helicobacter pullorum]STQ88258.1 Protein of uncharacterised function (DUF2971) [Helicobacter pullorum]